MKIINFILLVVLGTGIYGGYNWLKGMELSPQPAKVTTSANGKNHRNDHLLAMAAKSVSSVKNKQRSTVGRKLEIVPKSLRKQEAKYLSAYAKNKSVSDLSVDEFYQDETYFPEQEPLIVRAVPDDLVAMERQPTKISPSKQSADLEIIPEPMVEALPEQLQMSERSLHTE